MKMTLRIALLSAACGLFASAANVDCLKLSQSIKAAIAADNAATLQVVEKEILANPGCACEVVKAAIEASKADAKLVASIVETAATAAPEQMRLVSQCAVAMAPDALNNVQAVVAKLDPGSGESSPAKSSKSAKSAPAPAATGNPLDFPGSGIGSTNPIGINPGGAGGLPLLPVGPSIVIPPVIAPPPFTTP